MKEHEKYTDQVKRNRTRNTKRNNLLFGMVICILIAAAVCCLFGTIFHRRNRRIKEIQPDPGKPVIALTFDDGPNARYTPPILDILYEQQVPATFFLVGEKMEENKELVREIGRNGHEIGNHTFSHPDLTTLSCGQIQEEIRKTNEKIEEILPDSVVKYARPPYGKYTEETERAISLPLVLWNMDSGDWENPDAEAIFNTVVSQAEDRDIVIFHDDNEQTVIALEKIIKELKERGFGFSTVSKLCDLKEEQD